LANCPRAALHLNLQSAIVLLQHRVTEGEVNEREAQTDLLFAPSGLILGAGVTETLCVGLIQRVGRATAVVTVRVDIGGRVARTLPDEKKV
jgi:hypothetical protein